MIAVSCLSFLLGVLLAGRYKVLVLCPASFVVGLACIVSAPFDGHGFQPASYLIISSIVMLQLGYMAGLFSRMHGRIAKTKRLA